MNGLEQRILQVNDADFEEVALQVFRYQYQSVELYGRFCGAFGKTPDTVKTWIDIPFLPISFFKTHKVLAKDKQSALVFESSGTTGMVSSKHYVAEPALYERSFLKAFQQFYGNPEDYTILALLPSYLERGNSSLVYMADKLINLSGHAESGFFLHDFEKLHNVLKQLKEQGRKTLLLGVTYALLDFAEQFPILFPDLLVMETGGMKGRREELTRPEVHEILTKGFGVKTIHSEYGMTELLSQGYSKGNGIFTLPAWMRIVPRDVYEPTNLVAPGETGAVNVIDLANLYSCSFIATNDMCRLHNDGSFEILGRMDNAELRGCNLMYV
ncbi:MAG: acyl transferase [Chitinophagales bacterium]